MSEQFLFAPYFTQITYQLVMVGIVDGSAENYSNVIRTVSFRLFILSPDQFVPQCGEFLHTLHAMRAKLVRMQCLQF